MNLYQEFLGGVGSAVRRWIAAGVVVAGLHITGVAVALMALPDHEPDEEVQGAMVVELAPIAMSPPEEQLNQAIGPRAEDSEASTAPIEEVQETTPEETAPVEELPRMEEPEVALPEAKPEQKEEEKKEEEKKPQEAQPAPATVASAAAAPPPIEAAPAPVAAAPVQGMSRRPNQAQLTWQKSLVLHLNRHKRYPSEARKRQERGTVMISFSIDRAGLVTTAQVVKGSGSTILDEAAVAMLRSASPLPTPPTGISPDALSMSVPVKFDIR